MKNDAMAQTQPFVLTISRQLGSGAAFIGQQLAQRLGILYLDREILRQAALQLDITEEALQPRDETRTPLWQSLMQSFAYGSPGSIYTPPPLNLPTDHELFVVESRIISQVASRQSAVIIGRGGVHVLRTHPRHGSIFLHAPHTFRLQRITDIYQLSDQEARSALETSDQTRARYHRMVAEKDWHDARQYHLCVNTGVLGLTAAIQMILTYATERFGVTCAAE